MSDAHDCPYRERTNREHGHGGNERAAQAKQPPADSADLVLLAVHVARSGAGSWSVIA